MRYAIILVLLSACAAAPDAELQAHLKAEEDFARHQYHVEQIYSKNFDNVESCYYADDELVCYFY